MNRTTRRIKIEDLAGRWERRARGVKPRPYIRLKGAWLLAAGFHPGDHVEVTVDAFELTIRLAPGWRGAAQP